MTAVHLHRTLIARGTVLLRFHFHVAAAAHALTSREKARSLQHTCSIVKHCDRDRERAHTFYSEGERAAVAASELNYEIAHPVCICVCVCAFMLVHYITVHVVDYIYVCCCAE